MQGFCRQAGTMEMILQKSPDRFLNRTGIDIQNGL